MKRGFTLIELLVVIAIISILATMLIPAIQEAQEMARQVKCLSQLRSLGTAMFMYAGDEDCFAPCYVPSGKEGTTLYDSFWPQKVMPYAGDSPEAVVCPNFVREYPGLKRDYNGYYWFASAAPVCRYGFNHRALGCGGYSKSGWGCFSNDGSTKVKANPSTLVRPARLIMNYDNKVSYGTPPCLYGSNWEYWKTFYFPEVLQHNGGMNVVFADGHGEWADYDSDYFSDNTDYWLNQ